MLDVFNIAKPQNCDIQTFIGVGPDSGQTDTEYVWNKPRGVSNVYMMLIGGGGYGDGASGGGSGAVTVWYGAAMHVPDSLIVKPRGSNTTGGNTVIRYRTTSTTPLDLLQATSVASSAGAGAAAATPFAASGFYASTAGQSGSSGAQSPSATTFLSGGGNGVVTANYGYSTEGSNPSTGYFQLSPIIVGVGGRGTSSSNAAPGCGTGQSTFTTAQGGPGLVLIASW